MVEWRRCRNYCITRSKRKAHNLASHLAEIFEDKALIDRIIKRLLYLHQLAELESSRVGKIGMQVGSLRESFVVALLIYKFGENRVNTEIPIIMPEVDV